MTFCIHSARAVRRQRNRAHGSRKPLFRLLALAVMVGGVLIACGKKGPPLPPLIRVPAPSEDLSARRLGDTVYVRFTIPARNQDNSKPADITRVDVYGYTGIPVSDDDYVKYGTLVARIPVRKPPDENEQRQAKETADKKQGQEAKPAEKKPKVNQEPGFDQGATITVSEKLTPALLQPVVHPAPKTPTKPAGLRDVAVATVGQAVTRVYVAVGRNHKGRPGVFSRPAGVSIAPVPAAPTAVKITYTESQITIGWTPPDSAPAEAESAPAGGQPLTFNVYAAPVSSAQGQSVEAPSTAGTESVPVPLNDKPIAGTSFPDSRLEFGTERCYVVRTVVTTGTAHVESEPSEVACVTPKDVFPPAAPKGLTAVTSAGAINLLWEPNTEPDLDGYLVLRGDAPNGTLQAITAQPIHETTFNDTTVKAGVRYVYAVVAVDKTGNMGAQSNRVEETGR